jgi:hypothetical protein
MLEWGQFAGKTVYVEVNGTIFVIEHQYLRSVDIINATVRAIDMQKVEVVISHRTLMCWIIKRFV